MHQPTQTLNIEDIIRIVPFSQEVRAKLTEAYPSRLDTGHRVELERYLWRMYYLYFDLIYEEHLQLLIQQHPDGLPENYHDNLLELTDKAIHEGVLTTKESENIHQVREEIEKIISTQPS